MNKASFLFWIFVTISTFISCSNNSKGHEETQSQNLSSLTSEAQKIDTAYVHTGFYFLADDNIDGNKIKLQGSNEFYSLANEPFASVVHIKETELKTTKLDQGDYVELCLRFDDIGTKDLEEGTGNAAHPKIAVVIAGKLIYVIDNNIKITSGIMCVGLSGYSKEEMEKIKITVDQKN